MHRPPLTTSRLRLLPLQPQHADRLATLGNDPLVAAYMAGMPSPYTPATALPGIAEPSGHLFLPTITAI